MEILEGFPFNTSVLVYFNTLLIILLNFYISCIFYNIYKIHKFYFI